ncbi:MAG: DUF2065 domain-containing protein [Zoogloeaceae bacterium]|jgi:uncharacterized protein YjeT (DUF2065 family)|nr:DUF2065 domain-containing protein [Zoogloeaceae bacterium]
MTQSLVLAVALMLIIEGILPFIAPAVWREMFQRLTRFSDGQLRFIGLTGMLLGLVLLMVFK